MERKKTFETFAFGEIYTSLAASITIKIVQTKNIIEHIFNAI